MVSQINPPSPHWFFVATGRDPPLARGVAASNGRRGVCTRMRPKERRSRASAEAHKPNTKSFFPSAASRQHADRAYASP